NAALISSWHAGLRKNGSCRLPSVTLEDKSQLMFRFVSNYDHGTWSIYLDSLNGTLLKRVAISKTNDWKITTVDIPKTGGVHHLYFKYENPTMKSFDETGVLFDWFLFGESFPGKDKPGYAEVYKNFSQLLYAKVETTPILFENTNELFRTTHIFERGNWLVKGNQVNAKVPAVMNPMSADAPKNRLGLALWMTDKNNPLVSRTMVNRLWEQLFGQGLAETLEDLGTQGIPPTHQELLDHLSWKFMNDFDWSIKKLLKEMVLSATYRQASKTNEQLLLKDPNNKFYARGPRIRLSAEQLRDQSLAVSDLLSGKMYGKSVMPFQPDGIWRSPYNGDQWVMSHGEDQNRRALYTYWKRTAPYPTMITYDGGAREVCVTRRIRTNTPLQALTTLNDSAYFVMARSFAFKMEKLNAKDVEQQISRGYESMFFKPITENRLRALTELYSASINRFKKDEKATQEIMGANDMQPKPETAALVMVANAMLNLDEWVNKN
ncbi:MAG: hypothetical protein RI909_1221, partial [Bacteroidota bacterium]